jgi:hypothetical protein
MIMNTTVPHGEQKSPTEFRRNGLVGNLVDGEKEYLATFNL